ncbi:LLM class flavin-dependent oxidoreductase [Alicyclobacillus macrosporangiidus]|uniref:Flavin-dependent oxidoreductase, luciferase family (Includes alkanesulfonate monooxygenase SsuD and methylene tetrahydromethanopterin reductase) n=1 Tax=Alicyclobacillus macrosporangiidus TaxID=392015 RepID=A0A1I7FJ99_9BACL|nr:LLM class flavin-dependent oxidoreductase [Alicyclobacillus macrosporangiidus]SFU36215.1 Flavin-dependent oxidoreductase, luciferase family (includes alkanesulfonate monooxygenase SsuD and methylene tetrahydromethanopterin reductase) [Alicyclobacillus macrosporangiidus]
MRFSLFYNCDITPGTSVPELYQEIVAQTVLADQLGFDAVYLAEHHFEVYGRQPAPLITLARISGLTQRIALGTAVVEAPYYHPVRLAEDAALLDVLSGGRVRLGIGSGSRNKTAEFTKFGIPVEEKTGRTLETIEILRQAFDTGVIDFDGDFYRFTDVEICPRPRNRANDLIWLAASDSTVELAGTCGFPLLIPRVGTSDRHREWIHRYRAALQDRPGWVAQLRFVYVAETTREAQERTKRTFARYAEYECGVTWDGRTGTREYRDLMQQMNMVIGSPDEVVAQLNAWRDEFGFDEIICQVHAAGSDHAASLEAIELLAREVMPHFLPQTAAETKGT